MLLPRFCCQLEDSKNWAAKAARQCLSPAKVSLAAGQFPLPALSESAPKCSGGALLTPSPMHASSENVAASFSFSQDERLLPVSFLSPQNQG